MVERHLAKVNVASSNLVFRSKTKILSQDRIFLLCKKIRDFALAKSLYFLNIMCLLFHIDKVFVNLVFFGTSLFKELYRNLTEECV